jgi:F0F1-type ATP synthase membrane subunit b/b'
MKIQTRKPSKLELLMSEQGDVPGWVLITLMTAGLVVVIWAFAAPALQGVFDEAMDRVVKF